MKKQFIFTFTILICSISQYKGIAKNTVHEARLEKSSEWKLLSPDNQDFEIEPLCDYWAGVEGTDDWANGMVFHAIIRKLGDIPKSEMAEIKQFDELPQNLTYPDITPVLFQYLFENRK